MKWFILISLALSQNWNIGLKNFFDVVLQGRSEPELESGFSSFPPLICQLIITINRSKFSISDHQYLHIKGCPRKMAFHEKYVYMTSEYFFLGHSLWSTPYPDCSFLYVDWFVSHKFLFRLWSGLNRTAVVCDGDGHVLI